MREQALLHHAKTMRKQSSAPEQRLWQALRAGRLHGAKFRRQVVIGPYIADFACRIPCMLIIEIDGETHAEREAYDAARTRYLEARGYRVARFTNSQVMTNLGGVLLMIQQKLQTSPLPDPLP